MSPADLDALAQRLLETNSPAGTPIGGAESGHLIGRLEGKGDTMALAILGNKGPEDLQRIALDWIRLRGVQVAA
jgi:hypothetical protein